MKDREEIIKKLNSEQVKNLVFGGGGANGLCYAGCLWELAQTPGCENFENIERAAGTSIGSVAALAVCLKLTPQRMFEILASIDFKTIKDRGTLFDIYKRVSNEQSIYQGYVISHHVLALLSEVTGRKDPEKITFQDLKDSGYKDLYVLATKAIKTRPQLTTAKQVFSYETTPLVSVASAIRASMSAYPYFPGVKIQCNPSEPVYTFYDGAFKDNLAVGIFDYPKYLPGTKNDITQNSEDQQRNSSYSKEMFDYQDRRNAIKNNVVVDRIHNPHTLAFSIVNSDNQLPAKPLHSGNVIRTAAALIDGLITKEDNSLDPRIDRIIEVQRKIALTNFGIGDDKQKEIIIAGASSVARYFGGFFSEEKQRFICEKIDEIKKQAQNYIQQSSDSTAKKGSFIENYFGWLLWSTETKPTPHSEVENHKARL